MQDKKRKQLEDDLLVLILDNCSLRLYYESRYYPDNYRPNADVDLPGKSYSWYASKLQIGTKTLLRITKQACAKNLLEEKKVKRFRSFDTRYELTPMGKKIAKRLKTERTDDMLEHSKEAPLIKVRAWMHTLSIQEEPILVFDKEESLTSLTAVTLLREKTDTGEYILTRGDTIIVTVRREEQQEGNGQKILVKGIELSPSLYERIKRLVRIMLSDETHQFAFVPHNPVPCKSLSTVKNLRTNRGQKILEQWNSFKKTSS